MSSLFAPSSPVRQEAAPAPALSPAKRRVPVTPPWSAAVQRWLRRAHLYSGLAMLPFVLIYGVSAFLFNHPGGAEPSRLPATAPIAADAQALAAAVSAALGKDAAAVRDAELAGDWTFEFERDGARQRLTLPLAGGEPTLRPLPRTASRGERVAGGLFEPLHAAAANAAKAALGDDAPELRRTGAPTLRYTLGDEQTSVSLDRGQATHRAASAFDFGRLLMRLHTAHGYGDSWLRWSWALVVDVMAASMVLWAFSGLVMWWQRRSRRLPGSLVMLGTIGAAVVLAIAFANR